MQKAIPILGRIIDMSSSANASLYSRVLPEYHNIDYMLSMEAHQTSRVVFWDNYMFLKQGDFKFYDSTVNETYGLNNNPNINAKTSTYLYLYRGDLAEKNIENDNTYNFGNGVNDFEAFPHTTKHSQIIRSTSLPTTYNFKVNYRQKWNEVTPHKFIMQISKQ